MATFDEVHSKKTDRFDEDFKRTLPAMKALTEEEILNSNSEFQTPSRACSGCNGCCST